MSKPQIVCSEPLTSSDLWTNVTIPQAKNLSAPIHLPYAIGTADGQSKF